MVRRARLVSDFGWAALGVAIASLSIALFWSLTQ
jgi:hypothetical protein